MVAPSCWEIARFSAGGLGSGPLGAVLCGLRGQGESSSAAPPTSSIATSIEPRADAASCLASLMDLRASVQLAAELDALDALTCPPGPSPTPESVRSLARERGAELEEIVGLASRNALQGRNKLPTPANMHATLERWGALEQRSGRPLTTATQALYAPFGVFAANQVERVRAGARAVRHEIGPALRGLGPTAARLERLDAALDAATERGAALRIGRILPSLSTEFGRRLRAAVQALPREAHAGCLGPWFAPGGWVRGHLDAVDSVARAVLHHEQSRLETLTEAACLLAST